MSSRTFEKGQIIFREGEESTDAYFILSGRVKIRLRTTQGPCVLAELGPGEVFGEMGMIEDTPRMATAEALAPTELEVIGETDFAEGIMRKPERLSRYLATLFERLRHTSALVRAQAGMARPESQTGSTAPDPEPAPRFVVSLRSCYEETGFDADPIAVSISKLPFLIGRDAGPASSPFSFNDLAVPDHMPFQVSRNHCALEQRGDRVLVRDRGSTVGTVVNQKPIGVRFMVMEAELQPGTNDLRLGSPESPHRFSVTVQPST